MHGLPPRHLDPDRAERDEHEDDEEAHEVADLAPDEQDEPDDREPDVRPQAHAHCRRQEAARSDRTRPRAGEPGGDEEEDSDHDERAEGVVEELDDDVPGVARRGPRVGLGDELAHEVAPHEVHGDETGGTDDDERDADPAHGPAAVDREPHCKREEGEGENRKHPTGRLQDRERVLGGVELVRAQDLDLTDVLRQLVLDAVADAEVVRGLEHDPPEVQRHDAALGGDGIAVSLEHLHEGPVRLLDGVVPQPLQPRLLERARDERVPRLPQSGGRRGREVLEVGRELLP